MKSLLKRMDDKHIVCLEENKKKYPSSVGGALDELRKSYYWTDLSYFTVLILVEYLSLNSHSPSTIDALFTRTEM